MMEPSPPEVQDANHLPRPEERGVSMSSCSSGGWGAALASTLRAPCGFGGFFGGTAPDGPSMEKGHESSL